ncbi:MAG TPA: SGNH/GDSL hydrolase family protein [Terracidiphilus sp.]|nr:SGNH/GDSL hydrolase family protein [Terracidiphilus sp.]
MVSRNNCVLAMIAFLLALPLSCSAESSRGQQWVGTWATSPMLADGGFRVHAFGGTTLREIAHISIGGKALRLRFTNEFGTDPLTISNVHVALAESGSTIKSGTDHTVTFGRASSVKIPAGAVMYSDPVQMSVDPLSDVAVSFYIPSQVMRAQTFHDFADQDNYMANGDVAGEASLAAPTTLESWYFFDGIDVPAEEGGRAIVTLGDSITDGAHSTRNANRRWPDFLAARLVKETGLGQVGVLNEGIGGNRVLNDGYGPSALARLDRDLLAQSGVKYVIVLESINDIGRLARLYSPDDLIDAKDLELGLSQIASVAHEHGIKAIGATLTPYKGAGYFSEKGEQVRKEVNEWIRHSGTFDGVIDFDKITSDPNDPDQFNPADDSGDHLHPGDAGYKAMGEGIDLKLFVNNQH